MVDLTLFFRLVEDPVYRKQYLKNTFPTGTVFYGYFSNYIPEEILTAFGYVPFRLIGRQHISGQDKKDLTTKFCPFVVDCYTAAISGYYDFLSRIIIPHSCDSLYALTDLWHQHVPGVPVLPFIHPSTETGLAVNLYQAELENLVNRITNDTGKKITIPDLIESVKIHNLNREILNELYQYQLTGLIKPSEFVAILTAGLYLPKQVGNETLTAILPHIEKGKLKNKRNKIILSGPLVDNIPILQTIENIIDGSLVLDISNGYRYFDTNIELEGNVYTNIAKRYLSKIPSPSMFSTRRADWLIQQVQVGEVNGIIFLIQRNCEPHFFAYPELKNRFLNLQIPVLLLSLDHQQNVDEYFVNKVTAFWEQITG